MLNTLLRRFIRCGRRCRNVALSARDENEPDRSRVCDSSAIDWKSDDPSRLRKPESERKEAESSDRTD